MKVLLTNQAEYTLSEEKCTPIPIDMLFNLTKQDSNDVVVDKPAEILPEYVLFKTTKDFRKNWHTIMDRVDKSKPALVTASGNIFIALEEPKHKIASDAQANKDNNATANPQEDTQK